MSKVFAKASATRLHLIGGFESTGCGHNVTNLPHLPNVPTEPNESDVPNVPYVTVD